jgi:hypothetical protein
MGKKRRRKDVHAVAMGRKGGSVSNEVIEAEAEIVSDQEKPDYLPQPAVKVVKDEPHPASKKAAAKPKEEDRNLTEDEADKL